MKKNLAVCVFSILSALNIYSVNAENLNIIEVKDLKGIIQENKKEETKQILKGKIENYAEFHIINEIQLDLNDVTGPGRASSSLTDGTMYLENVNFFGKGVLGKLNYTFNAGGRATNDHRIDARGLTLTSLKGTATYEDHTLSVGDVFESFSQYTLNSNLKGVSYKFYDTTDNLPDVTAVFGYAYPRWDSAFQQAGSQVMQRTAYGANIRKDITYKLDAGLSFIRTTDAHRQLSSDSLFENNVYGMDFEYRPIPGLTIRGENAFANGRNQLQENAMFKEYFGHAHKLSAIGVGGPSRVNIDYEYVSPNFESLLGSAIKNRQKAKAKWKYKINRDTEMNTALMWYQSNMDRNVQSVHTYRPEIGFIKKRFLGRRYARAGVNYKLNISSGNQTQTNDHFINFDYRDRFGFLDCDNTFGFNTFNTDKRRRKTYEYNYHTSLSSRHRAGIFVFKPSLNAGTNFIDDEIRNTLNKIVEYSVGMGIDIPKRRISSNIKFGQNMLVTGIGNDSNKLFTNFSIYYRPSFIGFLNSSTFFLRVAINDFNFSSKTRNFSEKSISMGMNMPVDLFVGKQKPDVERL